MDDKPEGIVDFIGYILGMLFLGTCMLVAYITMAIIVISLAVLLIACLHYGFNLPIMESLIIGAPISAIFVYVTVKEM